MSLDVKKDCKYCKHSDVTYKCKILKKIECWDCKFYKEKKQNLTYKK